MVVMYTMFRLDIDFICVFLSPLDTIPEKVFNSILTSKRKYITPNKLRKGSMLKETWDILDVFFKNWNKKLASLLNDERYLWRDAPYKFKHPMNETEVIRITNSTNV